VIFLFNVPYVIVKVGVCGEVVLYYIVNFVIEILGNMVSKQFAKYVSPHMLKQREILLFVFLKWLFYEEGWAHVIIMLMYLSFPYKFLTDAADNQKC
jgi:hypothetical protein